MYGVDAYGLGVGVHSTSKADIGLPGKWEIKLPWRKAGLLTSSRSLSGFGPVDCQSRTFLAWGSGFMQCLTPARQPRGVACCRVGFSTLNPEAGVEGLGVQGLDASGLLAYNFGFRGEGVGLGIWDKVSAKRKLFRI